MELKKKIMKCDDFDSWIHLHRPGELEIRERNLLEEHIKSCMRCKEKHDSMGDYAIFLGTLQRGPELHFPETLTRRIMDGVNELSRAPQRSKYFFSQPFLIRIQWILGMTVIILSTWFFFENVYTFHKITSLEQRVRSSEKSSETNSSQGNPEMKMAVIFWERISKLEKPGYPVLKQGGIQTHTERRIRTTVSSNTSYWIRFLPKNSNFLAEEKWLEKMNYSFKTL